jgi:hypothetical protein
MRRLGGVNCSQAKNELFSIFKGCECAAHLGKRVGIEPYKSTVLTLFRSQKP